jgi:hypothetical protein
MRAVCTDFECELVEFNDGENNHIHLLVNFPPKLAIARLVSSLKGRVKPQDAAGVPPTRSGAATRPTNCGRARTSPAPSAAHH